MEVQNQLIERRTYRKASTAKVISSQNILLHYLNKATMNFKSQHLTILPVAAVFFLQSCNTSGGHSNEYYSREDFYKVKKTDVHAHVFTTNPAVIELAKDDKFTLLNISVDAPGNPPVDSQQYYTLLLHRNYPKNIYNVTTFRETVTINEPGWSDRQLAFLKKCFDSGAIAVKVWKNIGMTIRDKDSNFIMIDNPVFDPIFNYLEQNNIPVIGHIGEPKNCWLPLEEMTTNNDRSYFKEHPQYHMYLHPDYPSYEAQIKSRDHLLEKHPNLKFIGAHLGSLEWDVDEIAKRLDKFPNMAVEPAARMGQLQYQTVNNWKKVRDFFIKYQDRILYGTDISTAQSDNADTAKANIHDTWMNDWIYFATAEDSLQSAFINSRFKGLHLPKEVLDKMYHTNAEKWYFSKKN
jgi:predicted TIM-barrel fold metal-dependent hydrolase